MDGYTTFNAETYKQSLTQIEDLIQTCLWFYWFTIGPIIGELLLSVIFIYYRYARPNEQPSQKKQDAKHPNMQALS